MEWTDLFTKFFDHSFASRWAGTCGGWTKELAFVHVIADLLIWISYMTIPFLLLKLKKDRKDMPFNFLLLLFSIFIISCGFTHLSGAVSVFFPLYYVDFWIKFITAISSLGTAFVLWKIYPKIIDLKNLFVQLSIFEDVNKELETANKDLENFALIAAHDLQDPLKQNLVFIKMIQDGKLEFIPELEKNNTRMSDLIKNLLDFARSGGVNIKIESTDIKSILDDIIKDLNAIIKDTEIIIKEMPCINCDPVQIRRVFQNLIKNSIKGKSTLIEISCEKLPSLWQFNVKDNGCGISKETMPIIFTIYKGKKNDSTGIGFGLAICKRIIESHEGTINVESEIGKGSNFIFTIKDK